MSVRYALRLEGKCPDTTRLDAYAVAAASGRTVPWRGASESTVPWRDASESTVPWRGAVKILPRLLRCGSTGNVGLGLRSERSLLTLLAYSHCWCIHMSGVDSLFSWYPSHPAWSLRGSSHTPWVGSLFSRYPSRPAWSLRGSSHTPCVGSLFSRYPSRPAWSLRGFSHTPCVGSLFWGGMVAAPVTGIER